MRKIKGVLAGLGVGLVVAAGFGAAALANEAGVRPAHVDVVEPSSVVVDLDCPEEDSCAASYDGERNVWVIRKVVP